MKRIAYYSVNAPPSLPHPSKSGGGVTGVKWRLEENACIIFWKNKLWDDNTCIFWKWHFSVLKDHKYIHTSSLATIFRVEGYIVKF